MCISLALTVLIAAAATIIDASRVAGGNRPIFAVKTGSYEDGGSKRLTGLGYTVKEYNEPYVIDPEGINERHVDKGYAFKHWFLPVSGSKVTTEKQRD